MLRVLGQVELYIAGPLVIQLHDFAKEKMVFPLYFKNFSWAKICRLSKIFDAYYALYGPLSLSKVPNCESVPVYRLVFKSQFYYLEIRINFIDAWSGKLIRTTINNFLF